MIWLWNTVLLLASVTLTQFFILFTLATSFWNQWVNLVSLAHIKPDIFLFFLPFVRTRFHSPETCSSSSSFTIFWSFYGKLVSMMMRRFLQRGLLELACPTLNTLLQRKARLVVCHSANSIWFHNRFISKQVHLQKLFIHFCDFVHLQKLFYISQIQFKLKREKLRRILKMWNFLFVAIQNDQMFCSFELSKSLMNFDEPFDVMLTFKK
jgi:hypothetical protein